MKPQQNIRSPANPRLQNWLHWKLTQQVLPLFLKGLNSAPLKSLNLHRHTWKSRGVVMWKQMLSVPPGKGKTRRHVLYRKTVTWTRRQEQREMQQRATHATLFLPELSARAKWPAFVRLCTGTGCAVRIYSPGTCGPHLHGHLTSWAAVAALWVCYKQILCAPQFAGTHPRFSWFTLRLGLCFLSSPGCFLSYPCPHCYHQVF